MPVMSELDHAACDLLLRRETFGRVVMITPHGAEIVPVNYAVAGDAVVIRTSTDGLLARHGHHAPLVFEIDWVDHDRWQGWSVVARGQGEIVHLPETPEPGRWPRVRPWPDGERGSELWLAWTELSGRQVGRAAAR